MIQRGIGEKVGELFIGAIMFFVGYFLAFFVSWKYSLILLGGVPAIMISAIVLAKSGMAGIKEEMVAYQ